MIRKLNRIFQDYMREKRLKIGKFIWDRKENKEEIEKGNFIEKNKIKSILFLRYDGKIGDMVVNTVMFREIKKQYPNIKIGVVARGGAKEIIKNNLYVDKIYNYEKNRNKIKELAKEIRKEKYDLLIDFSEMLRVNQMMLINLCKARFNMGLNRESWQLFDKNYSFPKGNFHIVELYKKVLEEIGIKNPDLNYDLHFTEREIERVEEVLKQVENKKIFVVNPFAASKHRDLSIVRIQDIIKVILKKSNRIIFLIGEKKREEELKSIIKEYAENVVFPKFDSIMETAYLIKKSDFVITPDTSIVHISATFKKKMIAIYREDLNEEIKNKDLWSPNYNEAIQIFSRDLDVKKGEEPDINKFRIIEIDDIINGCENKKNV